MAVALNGGVRIRIIRAQGGEPGITVRGNIKGYSAERFSMIVRDIKPDADGTVDVQYDRDGKWTVVVNGPLSEGSFAQRFRNVLFAR